MKTIIIILLTLTASAQRVPKFTYTATVSGGGLSVKFLNEPSGFVTSTDRYGYFTTKCRENYIEFIVQLIKLSRTDNRFQNYSFQIEEIEIMLQPDNPFIWIRDDNGRIWKISKPNALLLANQLNTQDKIDSIDICYLCE